MAKHIDATVKQAVLEDIKNGVKVSEASVKHGVTSNAIYLWLKAQADNTGTSSLEVAKLRRENQELKEIIGLFALEKKRAEKNTGRP
ncbi:transposase [Candidatus Uhrbacteria bacterium]|nr:transposase [Candidatus Uhrbacteria bacterium]